MKTLRRALSFAAVFAVFACVCACAYADTGNVFSSPVVQTYTEYIAGGIAALFIMRWLTRKIKKDRNDKAEKIEKDDQ